MNIIVTGTTGTVGSEVVRQAVADDSIKNIVSLARKECGINHPKVRNLIHTDFHKYTGLETEFRESDACLWCLGISQSRVSKNEYYQVTYEYTVAAARAMLATNPAIAFLFLSGLGADSSETSRVRFAKVKGQIENALKRMNFKSLFIFRPGGIYPVVRNNSDGIYKKFEILVIRLMKIFAPSKVIPSDVLAKAMLKSIKNKTGSVIMDHGSILALGKVDCCVYLQPDG
jgi:nucleoside-diphosphate-sugar epimerase